MQINIDEFREYEKDGWITSRQHPNLPLLIWNYSPNTQYEYKWDEITTIARGLVTELDGTVIAKPFPKFFNLEENRHDPTTDFEVFEKIDGSLGIVFVYDNQVICATRGSFQSDQAIFAHNFLVNEGLKFIDGITYLFEITYPENRVVVRYDEPRMVFLGAYDLVMDYEFGYDSLHDILDYHDIVPRYDGVEDYTTLKDLNTENAEGFVIRFSNGDRCKIKFEDYVRLHKLMTNLSTTSIWEKMKFGTKLNLDGIPDELFNNIKSYQQELQIKYNEIETEAKEIFTAISHIKNRKKFANQVLSLHKKVLQQILFSMLDKKDYSDIIWKAIKPEYEKI